MKLNSSNLALLCLLFSWKSTSTTADEASCNYVDFDSTLKYSIFSSNIGTFQMAANKCQSLKVAMTILGQDINADGGIKFACQGNNSINFELYNDVYCNDLSQSTSMTVDDAIKIEDYIEITLNDFRCDAIDCGITFAISQNCSWTDNNQYINLTYPPSTCLTLSGASSMEKQIIPSNIQDFMESKSFMYKCCSDDNSLLVYNYSDTSCSNDYNMLRISNDFDDTCFDIDSVGDSGYNFVLDWSCGDYVDCDDLDIPFVDESELMDSCSDECYNNDNAVNGWTTTTTSQSPYNMMSSTIVNTGESAKATTGPTNAPTLDSSIPLTTGNNNNSTKSGTPLATITSQINREQVIGMCVAALVLFLCCFGLIYWNQRRSRMKRAIKKQNEMLSKDKNYAPISSELDTDDIVAIVEPAAHMDDQTTATATMIMDTTTDTTEIIYDTNPNNSKKSKNSKNKNKNIQAKEQLLK